MHKVVYLNSRNPVVPLLSRLSWAICTQHTFTKIWISYCICRNHNSIQESLTLRSQRLMFTSGVGEILGLIVMTIPSTPSKLYSKFQPSNIWWGEDCGLEQKFTYTENNIDRIWVFWSFQKYITGNPVLYKIIDSAVTLIYLSLLFPCLFPSHILFLSLLHSLPSSPRFTFA